MFTVIHNYAPKYIEGLFESGMVQTGDGFKISQMFCTPEEMRFNQIAAVDGPLHRLVSEIGSAFYVDRLQGGTYISKYPFDLSLAEEYDRITDGNFLGFQLHESGTTRALDWKRIQTQLQNNQLSWTLDHIIDVVTKVSYNKRFPHFSSGFPEEYAALTPPETLSAYVEDLRQLWLARQEEWNGKILNCDAGWMLCGIEKNANPDVSFIEIGGQTENTRVLYGLRRGISRARKKKWGVYLEPWNSNPCTTYCFMEDQTNDWFCTSDDFPFQYLGCRGGSSMSLARRIMYYSLFSGTDYFAEEWGTANTFCRWKPYVLSPYGIIKQEFLRHSRNYTEIKPYVPVAFVLPREYAIFTSSFAPPPFPDDMVPPDHQFVSQNIHTYLDDGRRVGMEDYVFETGGLGSIFDIIYDDSYTDPAKEYELLIDFSDRLHGSSVVNGYDRHTTDFALSAIHEKLPFRIEADQTLDYQIFEDNNHLYVVLYNHKGMNKTSTEGEFRSPSAAVSFQFYQKNKKLPKAENICGIPMTIADHEIHGMLPAGDFIIFQLTGYNIPVDHNNTNSN